MATMTPDMHVGQVHTDAGLVARLVARQFPQWAALPVRPVPSYGTDHDVYRLGEHLAIRLPIVGWACDQAAKEAGWLPRLAPFLPLALPVPVARGRPAEEYPFDWSVVTWLPGVDANGMVGDLEQAAVDLAVFVRALRGIAPDVDPSLRPGGRGGPLAERDADVRRSVAELGTRIDGAAALRSWEESLHAPAWAGPGVWLHGDLLPGNLLVVGGRLSAVIDFGGLAIGDPACDLQPAWNTFSGSSRRRFLDELAVDEASRLRGRGWVLSQALSALLYYWTTNPGMVRQSRHALAQVLADGAA